MPKTITPIAHKRNLLQAGVVYALQSDPRVTATIEQAPKPKAKNCWVTLNWRSQLGTMVSRTLEYNADGSFSPDGSPHAFDLVELIQTEPMAPLHPFLGRKLRFRGMPGKVRAVLKQGKVVLEASVGSSVLDLRIEAFRPDGTIVEGQELPMDLIFESDPHIWVVGLPLQPGDPLIWQPNLDARLSPGVRRVEFLSHTGDHVLVATAGSVGSWVGGPNAQEHVPLEQLRLPTSEELGQVVCTWSGTALSRIHERLKLLSGGRVSPYRPDGSMYD